MLRRRRQAALLLSHARISRADAVKRRNGSDAAATVDGSSVLSSASAQTVRTAVPDYEAGSLRLIHVLASLFFHLFHHHPGIIEKRVMRD